MRAVKGPPGGSPREGEGEEERGGLLASGARATRGLGRMGRAVWSSSCSRNAHDRKVLVRRAQSRIDQAALENEWGIGITRAVEDRSASIPEEAIDELRRIICNLARRL